MIVKFDGIDGCGKSTLSAAVREAVSARGFSAALVGEFSSPCLYNEASKQMSPISSMMIRESVLDPSFDCDDIERQLLLHYLSRRRNRVEIALLSESFDYVIVDRSTLSNYAYASALSPRFRALTDLAVDGMERADAIFWIDAPVDVCMDRLAARSRDSVESKGMNYFMLVRKCFADLAEGRPNVIRLDGQKPVAALVDEVDDIMRR